MQAVILLNWKRPQNIGRIVRTAAEALPDAAIFIIDQAEGTNRLAGRSDIPFDRCLVRTQKNVGPAIRFKVAAELPFDHYLCIDDDMFLTVEQIRGLMAKLEAQPEAAHGLNGTILTAHPGRQHRMWFNVRKGRVSFLNQVYAFTRERAQAALELARKLGFERWEDIGRTEDIILSCAGPCRVHDFGPLEKCETSDDWDIAVHKSAGFRLERRKVIVPLIERGAMLTVQSNKRLDISELHSVGLDDMSAYER